METELIDIMMEEYFKENGGLVKKREEVNFKVLMVIFK